MGVAGGGKSTQGRLLADEFGYAWISTGEILRVVITGTRRREMLEGKLLSDEEMIGVMDKVLGLIDKTDEFILDGFPRTVPQAKWLMKQVDKGQIKLTAVIHLNADEKVVHDRLKSRGRIDDTEEAIAKRFSEYRAVTLPILDHLRDKGVEILDVDASKTPAEVHDVISNYLETKKA
jgi:adenylate kinase